MQRKRKLWEINMSSRRQVHFLDAKENGCTNNAQQKQQSLQQRKEKQSPSKASWDQLEILGGVKIFPQGLCSMSFLRYLYMSHNRISVIPPEIAQLKNLVHLDLSYNMVKILPPEIGEITELKELHLQCNQIRCLPMQLGRLFQLTVLNLNHNPLNPDMLQLYNSETTQSMLSWLLDSEGFAMTPPPSRKWCYLGGRSNTDSISRNGHASAPNNSQSTTSGSNGTTSGANGSSIHGTAFTVMCYNVLCEAYATKKQYPYCPSWALQWEYRRRGIMDELRAYQADILCLQEVETEQFGVFFRPELAKAGYEGIFSPKSRARTMTANESKYVDGVAIFWKRDRFTLVKEDLIEFSQMAVEKYEKDCKANHQMINRVMVRDNVAIMAIFEVLEESTGQRRQLVVSTAHIHWDPEYSDVKLIQSIMLLSALWKKIENHLREQNPQADKVDVASMPTIICGDFNSLPDSGVFEYLSRGRVNKSHLDFKELGYAKILDKLTPRRSQLAPTEEHLEHDFNLLPCYFGSNNCTNFTYGFRGVIDYIFFTADHFNNIGYLDMIPESWFAQNGILGCPHPHISSDHFSLLAELELLPASGSSSNHGNGDERQTS
ncbi:hypothetical protein BOX15_Mlig018267g2 [Macrostomum lignano]|uniref:Uncharacterized protein n=2 Tax=Macrostomum lignano TaxID=282301 RepID=A0A267DTK4_9PLAT|nr:hypothetical protein BOX15_Mlig018267g2 [Macrostomum lignano]